MKDGLVRFERVWKKYRRGERHDSRAARILAVPKAPPVPGFFSRPASAAGGGGRTSALEEQTKPNRGTGINPARIRLWSRKRT